MKVSPVNFNTRVLKSISNANKNASDFKTIKQFPNVVRMFHIITPHAIEVLNQNQVVLQLLERDLMNGGRINQLAERLLETVHLHLHEYENEEANVLFYGLRGTSLKERMLYQAMLADFEDDPNAEDIIMAYRSYAIDLQVDDSVSLMGDQIENLIAEINQNEELVFINLMRQAGLTKLFVFRNQSAFGPLKNKTTFCLPESMLRGTCEVWREITYFLADLTQNKQSNAWLSLPPWA